MKKDLLKLKLKEEIVDIQGEKIIVRELTAGQASKYQHSLYKMVGGKPVLNMQDSEIKLVLLACYDEEGNRYFEDNDLELIKNLPQWVIEKLYKAANKISGGNKEKIRKNS